MKLSLLRACHRKGCLLITYCLLLCITSSCVGPGHIDSYLVYNSETSKVKPLNADDVSKVMGAFQLVCIRHSFKPTGKKQMYPPMPILAYVSEGNDKQRVNATCEAERGVVTIWITAYSDLDSSEKRAFKNDLVNAVASIAGSDSVHHSKARTMMFP